MVLVFAAVIAVVLVAIVAVWLGYGDGLDAEPRVPPVPLPDGAVTALDVQRLRFVVSPRGYRMDQVDATLDRLAGELAERDRRIASLEARLSGGPGATASAPDPR